MAGVIPPAGRADAGAFLVRLLRLDPAAVVRLRPVDAGVVQAWARVPFGVLVTRPLRAVVAGDVTVRAAQLLPAMEADAALPTPVDHAWRWSLPPGAGEVVESLPADEVRRLAAAAGDTLRSALEAGVGGRVVGSRRVRDALLDHVPIVIDTSAGRVEVPQRSVQALARMGFIGDGAVSVRRLNSWTGLSGGYGTVWYRPTSESLAVQVRSLPSNG